MDDFETRHPRIADGRFTDKTHSGPELSLPPAWGHLVSQLEPAGDQPAVDRYVDRDDVAPNLAAFDEYVDMFVSSIERGHLSRGIAGAARANAARAWASDAVAAADAYGEELEQFRDGVRRGIVALYYEKVSYEGSLRDLHGFDLATATIRALEVAETKRASKPEREFWRQGLQHASAAEHRGMLVAAAALSGTDEWWGFRDHPKAVMTGED